MARIELTDETVDKLGQLIESGNYVNVACAAAGVHRGTYTRWISKGRGLMEMYPDLDPFDDGVEWPAGLTYNDIQTVKLARRIDEAEGKAEAYAVLIVRKHMPDQWTAAMTYLERRFPERWRKRQTVETTDGGLSQLDEAQLIEDPEAVALLHEALEHAARPRELPAAQEAPAEADAS